MDLRGLRLLCELAQAGSLARAAEALNLSQPTATKLIHRLESEVGSDLIYRGKRPIQLTPLGASIAGRASPLVKGIDSLIPEAPQDELDQPVVVTSTQTMLAYVLINVLGHFHKAHPEIRVAFREAIREASYEAVSRGQAHLMVGPKPPKGLGLDYEPLGTIRRVVLTPLDHPLAQKKSLTFHDLAQWPLILTGRDGLSTTSRALTSGFHRRGLTSQIAFEVGTVDAMKRCVAMGLGISVGPAFAIEPEDLNRLAVISAPFLTPNVETGIVTLPGKPLPPQAHWMREVITRDVPALLEKVYQPS